MRRKGEDRSRRGVGAQQTKHRGRAPSVGAAQPCHLAEMSSVTFGKVAAGRGATAPFISESGNWGQRRSPQVTEQPCEEPAFPPLPPQPVLCA